MRIHSVATARRFPARVLAWLTAPLFAVLLIGAAPRTAQADVFGVCLDAADQWYHDCAAQSGHWFMDYLCQWVGGLLIMLCVVIGFIEKLVESLI